MSWRKPLPAPIRLQGNREIKTLSEAGKFILTLSAALQAHPTVTYATELLLIAANTGNPDDQGRCRSSVPGFEGQRVHDALMPKDTIELFGPDDAIRARGEREGATLTHDEMMQWARDACGKFGIVWAISDRVAAPDLGYARILRDGAEVLRITLATLH